MHFAGAFIRPKPSVRGYAKSRGVGRITSLFVRKVIRQADDGLDKAAFLRRVGVDMGAPTDPEHMVSDADYYAFFEAVARADPNGIELPLRTGASMRCEDYGAFGLAWKSASNLRGSYERAERYARILTSVSSYEVREEAEGALMVHHREGERTLGLRLSNEATMASVVSISQEVSTNEFRPLAVFFRHGRPSTTSAHEEHFGCPVHFGADKDALLVSHETLRAPNRAGELSFLKFFDTHLDRALAKLDDEPSLIQRVQMQVSKALSDGIPSISDTAKQLGMSPRTLQRRLSEQGYSYQALIDEARRRLAEQLLRETDYALAEIGFLTGFSEQSAFTRAFKRWAGQTPRSYRLSARSVSGAGQS